ncbi:MULTISPECIES: ATP-binding protein [Gordonia]|uniref:ATP-binding protein n=1 Tax=Gordonia TaxID=2053 RepID=UPI0033911DC3
MTATPESAHLFRQHFTRWLDATLDVDAERRSDIVLAVYEAVANAAEHAYAADAPSPAAQSPAAQSSATRSRAIEVRAQVTRDESLEVTVTDSGRWKSDASSSPYRGRGLALISALSDASDVTSGPDGTSVTLRWHQRLSV